MAAAKLAFIVKAIDDASGTLKGVGGELDHMEGKASKLAGVLKGGLMVGAGIAVAGIGALGVVLGQSVKEAMAAEESTAQLNAVLKSTKGVAGVSADAINEHALALSQVTRYEDDAIVGADSLLLTFTKIGKDVFPKATELTLDLATAFKMDLKSAAMMVGKALNDPVKGLTAMGKAGVTFTQSQKDMIKAMVEAGDVAGAQRVIMAELETQVGGSAKAAGETMAGQMDILKNTLGNVKEEIGGALIPILKDLVSWIGPRLITGFQSFAGWVTRTITAVKTTAEWFQHLVVYGEDLGELFDKIPASMQPVVTALSNIYNAAMNVSDAFKAGGIGSAIKAAVGEIMTALGSLATDIGTALSGAWASIGDWWSTNGATLASQLGASISSWWTGTFLPALAAIDWASIGANMTGAWNTLKDWWTTDAVPFATEVATNISTWFTTQVIPALQAHAPEWAAALTKMLKSMITINGQMLGDDANLAYTLGAGFVKLLISSLKALSIGPQLLLAALKSAFEGGLGKDADWGEIFGNIFGPIGDFLMGALDAMLTELLGEATGKIGEWWAKVWATLTGNPFAKNSGDGGRNDGGRSMQRTGNTGGRALTGGAGGMNVTIHINAPGGNPRAVAAAANNGVLQAARSLGIA